MKYVSRKFLISVAAFLGSLGTSIAALHTSNTVVATIGIICAMVSAAIYAACEAAVDAAAVEKGVEIVEEDDEVQIGFKQKEGEENGDQ